MTEQPAGPMHLTLKTAVIRDYDPLGAFAFSEVELPAQPGSYDTSVELTWAVPRTGLPLNNPAEEATFHRETRPAQLVIEPWRASGPAAYNVRTTTAEGETTAEWPAPFLQRGPAALLRDAPVLKGLPLFVARLRGLDRRLPYKPVPLLADSPDTNDTLIVPVEAARRLLWKKYQQTPEALLALAAALDVGRWGAATALRSYLGPVKQAFGLDLFDLLGHYLQPLETPGAARCGYYYLYQLLAAVAVLELLQAGDPLPAKLTLPPGDCTLRLANDKEEAEVAYYDPPGEQATLVLFRGQGKAWEDKLREAFRLRAKIRGLEQDKSRLVARRDEAIAAARDAAQNDTPLLLLERDQGKALEDQLARLHAQLQALVAQYRELRGELLDLYLALVGYAKQHKERVLQQARKRDQLEVRVTQAREAWGARRGSFIQLASNIEGLPAHFAAIPTGIADGLELKSDPFGRAILRVSRPPLDIPVKGQRRREHGALVLPLYDVEGQERSAVIQQVQLAFGEGGLRWLLPQGITATSMLYREGGGYTRPEYPFRLYLNEWIDAMRPGQVERFKKKGRGEAFGKDRVPADLWRALLGVLNRLSYERQGEGLQDTLTGFFLILGHGEDARGPYTDIMLNPKLFERIAGEQPLFMVTNAEAMLSYNRASLDYAPAAQLSIELLARENLYNRDTATLTDPQGGGITRYALAHRFGMLRGPADKRHHVLRRFNGVLDNLAEADVIEGWQIDGRESKTNPFGVKLHITMHDDYRKAYNLTREQNALRHAEKQLERPFAPPKKPAPTLTAPKAEAPPKRGRGRPRKAR